MKNAELARKIVNALAESLRPGACTWGDLNSDAHRDLFRWERADMEIEIEFILSKDQADRYEL